MKRVVAAILSTRASEELWRNLSFNRVGASLLYQSCHMLRAEFRSSRCWVVHMMAQPRDSASTCEAQREQCQDQSVQLLSWGIFEYQIFSQRRIKWESWTQSLFSSSSLASPPAGWTPWWQLCFCPGAPYPSPPSPCTPRTKPRRMPAGQEKLEVDGKSVANNLVSG